MARRAAAEVAGSSVTSWVSVSRLRRIFTRLLRFMCGHRLQGRIISMSGLRAAMSVSYTHLDVYKRQHRCGAVRVHAPTAPVRAVAPPAVEPTLTIAARGTGLKLVPCALRSLEHGEVTPDAVAPPRIAGEIAGSSPIGVDEGTARYLERLTRTAQGNQAGWSQEKK